MNKDIVPELLEKIQNEFKNKTEKSKVLKKKILALKAGKATHLDSNEFAIEVGNILADVFKNEITEDVLPDNKMYYNIAKRLIEPNMKSNYDIVSDYSRNVQEVLNKKSNISLKAIKPELNQDRIDGIVNKMCEYDDFKEGKWLLEEPIKNFTQSIVDDTIKTNADFQYKSGLTPKIVRKEVGSCCDWCKEVVGVYEYPDVPKDVYRRHRFCNCTVDYLPGNGKKQDVWSKKWTNINKDDKIKARKEFSEKPKTLTKDNLFTDDFKKGSGKNYPIKFIGSDHVKFDSQKVENVIVIAGQGVKTPIRDAPRLESFYRHPKNKWQKISGTTKIKFKGKTLKAEIHWYEANGQREEIKLKRIFEDES
ncbi:hypothetical protein [Peptoniphilus rhinitidis]|uniref:hypothetical protein n=1 Tax=Peptoniphilus rhinitidis TaxID=1175452 RepID=UPI000287F39B|nr:hypothetical protein [Peptoniphilus rhinitidis]